MRVKTYWAGRFDGESRALTILDRMVEEDLGTNVEIHSVTDTSYSNGIARAVIFSTPEK
ncbi:MAG: hypothetical protein Q7R69_02770 [bacterium]|nr:hypothetical protein [bacterium]